MKRILMICLLVLACGGLLQAQEPGYLSLYEKGEYALALKQIDSALNEIYSKRVEDKRVPTGFITLKNTDKDIDLLRMFRERKASGFFIEDNGEISGLHLYAARCSTALKKMEDAINHYYQCLRFRKLEYKRDDVIFHEMAGIFRDGGHFKAYISSLETAYSLNREEYNYSKELGIALYPTADKKRAIYHLERYVTNSEEKPDPRLYLMIGNLYEDIGKYLDTEKYYIRYLELKPDDGPAQFALGHIAYKRTGNYRLAMASLGRALVILPETDIIRRSRSHEYIADMSYSDLEYGEAVKNYSATIKYQEKIAEKMAGIEKEIAGYTVKINGLKTSLLKEGDFDEYEQYEFLKEEKAKKELELVEITRDFTKLNAGRIRWCLAESYQNLEQYDQAISWYRQAIAFDYNSNRARDLIVKLQLKIKRGY